MKLKLTFAGIVFSASALFSFTAYAAQKDTQPVMLDKVVAVVNDSVVTESQLHQQMAAARQQLQMSHTPSPANLRQKILDRLIDKELELQIAKNMGIEIDDAELDKAIAEIAARNGISVERLQSELQKQGVSRVQYRKEIREQMIISQVQQRALAGKVNVTDQEINEIAATLKRRPTKISPATEYQVQDILIGLSATPSSDEVQQRRQKAEALLAKLRQGENFQKLAAAESAGDQALQGGDLGWRKLNELPELFAQAVKTMQPGQLAGPLRAGNGFHIIRLAATRNQMQEAAPQQYTTETQVRQIFLKNDPLTTATANKLRLDSLRNDIVHGKSFAKLAAENSQDPNSAHNGGLMGWIKPGMVDPVFEETMNKLKPGEVSQPFASQYGWHIIQVVARRTIDNSKDLLREQARQIAFKRKADEAIQTWLQELRGQAYIKIMSDKASSSK